MKRAPDQRLEKMRGDVPGNVWPSLFSNQTATLAALIRTLDRTQWLSRAELAVGQHRQLSLLARHFAEHSQPFRDRLQAAGLDAAALRSPEGLAALPPLTRQQAQAKDPPIFCETVPKSHLPVNTVNTSGSTGEPVIVRRTALNQMFWLALTMRYHLWAEPDFRGRIAAIRAHMKVHGRQRDWSHPVATFFETGEGLLIDIESDVSTQLDQLLEFRPNSLVVYPSNLVALLDEMDARGVSIPELKRFRTVGESVAEGVRERVEERGAKLYDCYSSEEMGYIALQCPESGLYHAMAETLIVEVVDGDGKPCREGEAGKVLVTDIQNHATPMIRYDIADHAEVGPQCPCGRGLPTLRRILGRERNMIVKPDGTYHWPMTGYKKFREIAPIAQYQYRQHAPDRIEVRFVAERPITPREEDKLREEIRAKLRYPYILDFVYFEGKLPVGSNGKFEEFMRMF